MTMPFDHTHDIDLGVSRSESEIALSQEWGDRLTMDEKDVSHPFMTMILTSVTILGWADVPDSDRGDFRRRRVVDISSWLRHNPENSDVSCHLLCRHRWHILFSNRLDSCIFSILILKNINSMRPSDIYLRRHRRPSLVQIMVCRLFGAKSLSEPMLEYCHLDP